MKKLNTEEKRKKESDIFDVIDIQKSKPFPWIIVIENKTCSEVFDVPIFNFDHEKQDKLIYKCGLSGTNYNEMLRNIDCITVPTTEIDKIMIDATCGYSLFVQMQLNNEIRIEHKKYDSSTKGRKYDTMINPHQYQQSIIVVDGFENEIISREMNIYLKRILPLTTIVFSIYPKEIE